MKNIIEIIEKDKEDRKKEMYSKGYMSNRVIFGDCIEHMKKIPDKSINLCVTDPPWGISYDTFRNKFNNEKVENDEYENFLNLMNNFPTELYRVLKDNGVAYIFCGGTSVFKKEMNIIYWAPNATIKLFYDCGFIPSRMIIWNKITPGRMYKYRSKTEFVIYFTKKNKTPIWNGEGEFKDDIIELEEEIIKIKKLHGCHKVHPTQKPERIYESFIKDSSNPGDLIFDPFAGSGVIVTACKNTGRNYFAIEKREMYMEHIEYLEKRETTMEKLSKVRQLNINGEEESVIDIGNRNSTGRDDDEYSFMKD
jgi:site-specific DNA-methyltransferase (adenine-specific)